MTWTETVYEILNQLGGHAYLKDIYQRYQSGDYGAIRGSYQASIRAALERSSPDSEVFDGKEALFYMVEGRGAGHWGIIGYEGGGIETDEAGPDLTAEDASYPEGRLLLREHVHRERNRQLVVEAKRYFKRKYGKLFCEICGFCFEEVYGKLGEDFIEAHHIKPVSQIKKGERTRIEDLMMLCSNCHSMVHRGPEILSREDMMGIVINRPIWRRETEGEDR